MSEAETPTQAPAGVMMLAFCPGCDQAFLRHDGRPWSPCCAMEPVNTLDLNELVEGFNLIADQIAPLMAAGLGAGLPGLVALALHSDAILALVGVELPAPATPPAPPAASEPPAQVPPSAESPSTDALGGGDNAEGGTQTPAPDGSGALAGE